MLRHPHPTPPVNPGYATPVFTSTKRKRAANACRRCRTRKQRCDGLSIPCKNCSKAGAECTFPEDASGEHLLREHIAMLESRIGDLTAALQTVTSHSPSLRNNSQSHKQSGEATSLSSFEYPPVDPTSKSIISELEPGSMDQSRPKKDESVQEDDLVNGIGFLSLTSGAEPLYVGGSSGASWGRIFSSVLRRSTGRSKLSSRSLIPPQSLPAPAAPTERPTSQSRSSSSSFTSTSSSRSRFSSSPTRIPLHIRPKFVFPLLPTSKAVSNDIFATVYSIIQSRYSFMNFTALEIWHDQRGALCGPQEVQGNGERTAAFFLWLTYALGVRVWEGRGKTAEGLAPHEHYFQAALQYFDHVQSNITTIQALLFLAMYSFRSEKGLSAWHLSGLAMRTAVELGLHRKTPENKLLDPFMEETRKRVWWSVYCLERTMALQLGRPIAIQDTDIDIELPLDIDCRVTNGDQIRERALAISKALAESNTTLETNPYPLGMTSMSSSLHHIRLRKLLTKVKETVYHHQREKSGPHAEDVRRRENLDRLSKELDTWRRTSPRWVNTDAEYGSARATEAFRTFPPPDDFSSRESSGFDEGIRGDGRTPAYVYEWFDLQYYNAIQLLLIPYALTASPGDPYLHQAVIAAMHSCELQKKRVEKGSLAPLSIYTLHKVFMAGIFLLWALDKDPDVFLMLQSYPESHLFFPKPDDHHPISKPNQVSESCPDRHADPIASCSQTLSVYAEHYPEVKAYAECFDQLVIDRKAIWNKDNSCGTSPLNTQDSRGYPGSVAPGFPDKLFYRGDPLMHDMALRQPAFMAPTPLDIFLQDPDYSTRGGQVIDGFNLNLTRLLEQSHGLEAMRPGAVKSFESFKLDLSDPLIANIGNYGELDLVQYERPLDRRAMAPAFNSREDFFSHSGIQHPQSVYWPQTTPMNPPKDTREMYTNYDFNPLQLDGQNSQANDQERPHFSMVWPTSIPHEQVQSQNIEMQASTHRTDGESLHRQFSSDATGSTSGSVSQPYQFDSSLRNSTSSSLEIDRSDISTFRYTSTSAGQYENVNYQYPVSWEHHVHGVSRDQKNAVPPSFSSSPPTLNPSRRDFSPSGCSTLGGHRNVYQSTRSHSDADPPTIPTVHNRHPSRSSTYAIHPSSPANGSIERTEVRSIIEDNANSEAVRQDGYMTEQSNPVPSTNKNALLMPFNTVFAASQSSLHPFLGGMGDSQFWAALQAVAAGVAQDESGGQDRNASYNSQC